MAATPKRKVSTGKQGRRRTQMKLVKQVTVVCKKCGAAKRPHFLCTNCKSK